MSASDFAPLREATYAEALLGELRLLAKFEVYFLEPPPAFEWRAKMPEPDPPRAPMLTRIQEAGAIWSLNQAYRRMNRRMLEGFRAMSAEWNLFS